MPLLVVFAFFALLGLLQCLVVWLTFDARDKTLTARLQREYRYHILRTAFSKFYRRHYELVSKFDTGLGMLLLRCLSGPGFCRDSVCIIFHFGEIFVCCGQGVSRWCYKAVYLLCGWSGRVWPLGLPHFCAPVSLGSSLMLAPTIH